MPTHAGWHCLQPGEWRYQDTEWVLERRRSEPGNPSGWYLWGPEVYGRRLSDYFTRAKYEANLIIDRSNS
jgi:hypothetical protein